MSKSMLIAVGSIVVECIIMRIVYVRKRRKAEQDWVELYKVMKKNGMFWM